MTECSPEAGGAEHGGQTNPKCAIFQRTLRDDDRVDAPGQHERNVDGKSVAEVDIPVHRKHQERHGAVQEHYGNDPEQVHYEVPLDHGFNHELELAFAAVLLIVIDEMARCGRRPKAAKLCALRLNDVGGLYWDKSARVGVPAVAFKRGQN